MTLPSAAGDDPTAAPAPNAALHRIDSLDALRALAVLLVFAVHLQETAGIRAGSPDDLLYRVVQVGWIGVDLFYVLSGFFIGLAVMRPAEWRPFDFLARRARRILPAYYVSILLLVTLGNTYFITSENGLWHLLSHLALVHKFVPGHEGSINGVYWTLAVEWWFYILMLLCAPLLRSRRGFYPTVVAFFVVAYAWRAGTFHLVAPDPVYQRFWWATQLPGTLDEFGVGILTARWACGRPGASASPRAKYLACAFFALAVGVLVWSIRTLLAHAGEYWVNAFMVVIWRTFLAAGFGLTIVSFLLAGPGLGTVFYHHGLSYVGKISYSIYLYHYPVILAMSANRASGELVAASDPMFVFVCAVAVLILSSLSFYMVERPWLNDTVARVAAAHHWVSDRSEPSPVSALPSPSGGAA